MRSGRQRLAALLVVVAAVLALAALPLDHLRRTAQARATADHASAVLREPVVQDAIVDGASDAIAGAIAAAGLPPDEARAQTEPITRRVVASRAFERTWRSSVRAARAQVLDGDRRRISLTVDDLGVAAARASGDLPAPVVAALRGVGDVRVASFERSRAQARTTADVYALRTLGPVGLGAAAAVALLALLLAADRRRIVVGLGAAALVVGLLLVGIELLARTLALGGAAPGAERDIAAAVWDEVLGGLRTVALVLAAVGVAVAVGAAALRPARPVRRTRAVRPR
ncbi:hypothetical protein [Patulibacter sp. SYSU D01012]|uniref:hypothetical protein n=1 Tax=Patulibacter sp. SYSU D01012 TaxID=2817381 RepID=UPI001B306DEF|nr:hypothetical protein [Patulibacter sp. SYSU D01012]